MVVGGVQKYDMNSICIPRKAGEASGAITKLTDQKGASIIINVEYNQLDPLLRSVSTTAEARARAEDSEWQRARSRE